MDLGRLCWGTGSQEGHVGTPFCACGWGGSREVAPPHTPPTNKAVLGRCPGPEWPTGTP